MPCSPKSYSIISAQQPARHKPSASAPGLHNIMALMEQVSLRLGYLRSKEVKKFHFFKPVRRSTRELCRLQFHHQNHGDIVWDGLSDRASRGSLRVHREPGPGVGTRTHDTGSDLKIANGSDRLN